MTTLLVEELRTTLEQDFTAKKRGSLKAIRPVLYFHNDPAGTYTIKVKNGATELVSKSLTMAEIKTGASWSDNQYHWGVIKFQFDSEIILQKNVLYTIELSASGYTFAESAYMGWVKPFENLINSFDDTIESDYENPHGYEIWTYRN